MSTTVDNLVAAAIAEGRHSPTMRTVCDGCGEWVGGIYHVTLDKKRLCKGCFERIFKPAASAADLVNNVNAVSRQSRGEHMGPGAMISTPAALAVLPTGQPPSSAASQAAEFPPADARTGDEQRRLGASDMTPHPAAGPASTEACTFFDPLN